MIALILLALVAAAPAVAQTGDPPLRLSLNEDGRYLPSAPVRVTVRAYEDGYLVVYHVDPTGRLRILFPLDPGHDNYVRGGRKYELRGRNGREAFRTTNRTGRGVVMAALTPDRFVPDSFILGDHWDYQRLNDHEYPEDAEDDLVALARRMIQGDFAYDIAPYDVLEFPAATTVVTDGWTGPAYSFGSTWCSGYYYGSAICGPGTGWSISVGVGLGWGWGVGWGYPYYGWGYPAWGWGWPAYGWGYYPAWGWGYPGYGWGYPGYGWGYLGYGWGHYPVYPGYGGGYYPGYRGPVSPYQYRARNRTWDVPGAAAPRYSQAFAGRQLGDGRYINTLYNPAPAPRYAGDNRAGIPGGRRTWIDDAAANGGRVVRAGDVASATGRRPAATGSEGGVASGRRQPGSASGPVLEGERSRRPSPAAGGGEVRRVPSERGGEGRRPSGEGRAAQPRSEGTRAPSEGRRPSSGGEARPVQPRGERGTPSEGRRPSREGAGYSYSAPSGRGSASFTPRMNGGSSLNRGFGTPPSSYAPRSYSAPRGSFSAPSPSFGRGGGGPSGPPARGGGGGGGGYRGRP